MQAANIRIHLQSVEPPPQQRRRIGVVLQELRIRTEADQKSQILLSQHRAEELVRGVSFDIDQISLTRADIDQKPDRQRQVRLPVEILDVLLLAFLENREIVFVQISDQPAALVANVKQDVNNADVNLNGWFILSKCGGYTRRQKYRGHK